MQAFCTRKCFSVLLFLFLALVTFSSCVITSETSQTNPEGKPSSPVLAPVLSNELIELNTRPGVKQKFILLKPSNSRASVILLEGGFGKLDLGTTMGKPRVGSGLVTLLISKRENFSKQGLVVAVLDAPSDQQPGRGMGLDFRMGSEHAQDIEAVARYLKDQANLPVWLIGISAATHSASNAVIRAGEEIDGIVLLSSSTRMRKDWPFFKTHPNGILDMELDKIKVPALVVAHEGDKCDLTPPAGATKVKNALVNSPRSEVVLLSGGKSSWADPCFPHSPHDYYGIEDQVITVIAEFIRANSK